MGAEEKHYYFVVAMLKGVGGMQRYVLAKARWLSDNGWTVHFLYGIDGQQILDFSDFDCIHFVELMCRPSTVPTCKREELLRGAISSARYSSETIVESSACILALWGELLASRLQCRHLIFSLEEKLPRMSKSEAEFFRTKMDRGEFAGCYAGYLNKLFPHLTIEQCADKVLAASQQNPIVDDLIEYGTLPSAACSMLCFTRLEKTFVKPMLDSLIDYCFKHFEESFSLVFIGDADEKQLHYEIQHYADSVPNLSITILGYMTRIPRSLIQRFEIGIGTAGCAWQMSAEGLKVIAYATDEDECIGVLRYDIPRICTLKECRAMQFENVLDDLRFSDKYRKRRYEDPDIVTGYRDFLDFLDKASPSQDWVSTNTLACPIAKRIESLIIQISHRYPTNLVRSLKHLTAFAKRG